MSSACHFEGKLASIAIPLVRVGLQAGWVLPQARWTNPPSEPVVTRNSARIAFVASCGESAQPDGAASPQLVALCA